MGNKVYDNILQTIGDTPLVRINHILEDSPATIYAKVEYFNPGHSIKDRIGLRMVEDAERRDDHRMHLGQYRNGDRPRSYYQRLPLHFHHQR